jgi:hypothetical protein
MTKSGPVSILTSRPVTAILAKDYGKKYVFRC